MQRIMVAGIGTGVGKTIVSAILTLLFKGDYWKPIQCGREPHSDTVQMRKWLEKTSCRVFSPAYSFHAAVSPHRAACLENATIKPFELPKTTRPLIIEGVGGVLVPLSPPLLTIDLFVSWECKWVVVSRNYLGSINHTLLTIEALKRRNLPILGVIFNGRKNSHTESPILKISQLPLLGRLLPERALNRETLQRYQNTWHPLFSKLLP